MSKIGIGEFARNMMIQDPSKSNEDVLAAVRENFPEANTKIASIMWYRSKINTGKDNNGNPVVIVRTVEVLEAEIKATESKLEELKKELEEKKEAGKAEKLALFLKLKAEFEGQE